MLIRSLQLLASILILNIGVQGIRHSRPFGVDQWLLTDAEVQEPGRTAPSWSNSQVLRWLKPFNYDHWYHRFTHSLLRLAGSSTAWHKTGSRGANPLQSKNKSFITQEIPSYVFDYAPLVHLYSKEKFWPCNIAEHLLHVTPELDYTPIYPHIASLNLTNLDGLNEWGDGRRIYLTSDDDVEELPEWLSGRENIPDLPDALRTSLTSDDSVPSETSRPAYSSPISGTGFETPKEGLTLHQQGGRSKAPAVMICVDKGDGIVDAFWFFFYGFNQGNMVFNVRFGNHVGDWEHTLIRFQRGIPKYVFFSEHSFGSAFSYGAVEKIGKRPLAYSAVGTHAMYATSGSHPYILPLGILHDQTDQGPLWDPLLNLYAYVYNHTRDELRASNLTPHAPIEWFYFAGRWGDKLYPLTDKRQYGFAGQYHYVSGPLGPRFKNLGRRKVCQGHYRDPCVIKNWLFPTEIKYWKGAGDGEEEDQSDDE